MSGIKFEGPDYERFVAWWIKFRKDAEIRPPLRAIWQYFHREFPVAATTDIILDWIKEHGKITPAEVVFALERLWDGEQLPDKIEQRVCPTCGGSEEVCKYGHELQSPNSPVCDPEPCPDCTEKDPIYRRKVGGEHYPSPNERKGQRRVHTRRGNDAVYGHLEAIESPSSRGRRTGKDRRDKGEAKEKDSIYRRKIGSEHYPSSNERKGSRRRSIETSGRLQIKSRRGLFATRAIYAVDNEGIWRFDHRIDNRRKEKP